MQPSQTSFPQGTDQESEVSASLPATVPVEEPVKAKSIKEIAAEHTEAAINALVSILGKEKASDMAKIQAATALLDRGHGKPTQYVEQTTKVVTYQDLLDQIGEREQAYQQIITVDPLPAPPQLTWDDVT